MDGYIISKVVVMIRAVRLFFFYINTREVCTMLKPIVVFCPETNCQNYDDKGCTASVIYHSTDLFCVSYKRKDDNDYKQLMQDNKPIDFKKCEKAVSN